MPHVSARRPARKKSPRAAQAPILDLEARAAALLEEARAIRAGTHEAPLAWRLLRALRVALAPQKPLAAFAAHAERVSP